MIDNKNRAFFLNELDGFQANTGVVVLATTNHPNKLDASILDRPSRFDRKYYFHLPADAERLSYINFSFAYLKELFVASMVQWMSEGRGRSMDDMLLAQTDQLRKQMKLKKRKKQKD